MLQKLLYVLVIVLGVGLCGKIALRLTHENQLNAAVMRGDTAAVKRLLSTGTNPNIRNQQNIPILGVALNNGRFPCAIALLKQGAHVGDPHFGLYLSRAIESGRKELALLLIERGCDLKATDMLGQTPLMYAAHTHNLDIAEKLIRAGADIERTSKPEVGGCTPLMYAVGAGDTEMIRLLLRYGARINARSFQAKTPLCFALEFNKPEAVQALLEAGASQEEINFEKQNALTVAQQLKHPKIVALLQSHARKQGDNED